MNRIDAFLRESGWTEGQLASAARTSQSTVNRLRNDAAHASLGLSIRIETATGGRVRAEDVPMTRETRQELIAVREAALRDGAA